MDKILLNPLEAAEALGISRAFLYKLIALGRIRTVRIGRARRIPAEELQRFVRELLEEGDHER